MKIEEIEKLLGDKVEQGWHKDPENKISVTRELRHGETYGHHNLICQCNGKNFEGKEDLVDFIAAAPTVIRDLVGQNKRLREALKSVEWSGEMKWEEWTNTSSHTCPACKRTPREGHNKFCEIGDAIKEST